MSLRIDVVRPSHPGDASGITEIVGQLPHGRIKRLVVFGKTEGPATLNDYSRDLAQSAVEAAIRNSAGPEILDRTWRLFSTGCEGIASPMTTIIADLEDAVPSEAPGLAMGAARSRALPPNERCGRSHVIAAAETVRQAMSTANLLPEQVKLVLIKSPVLSPNAMKNAAPSLARHAGSTGSSRGAAALGAGVALGSIEIDMLGDDPVGMTNAFAYNVMAFSGTETDSIEAIVLGERQGGDPCWRISSVHLEDLLDTSRLGELRDPECSPSLVFFKAGIPPSGYLRGLRTTVLTSDLPADKQLRAAASGVVAAQFGMVDCFISAGAEHQGPPGSSYCATISATGHSPANRSQSLLP